MYLCIDESGDLGKYPPSKTPYFVIAGIIAKSKGNLDKVIFRVRKKLPAKRQRILSEIKHNNTTTKERLMVLTSICSRDCYFFSYVLVKSNKVDMKPLSNEQCYISGVIKLISDILSSYPDEHEFLIDIDKGPSSKVRQELEEEIKKLIFGRYILPNYTLTIHFLNSQASNEIQAVDFIAGAIHYYYRNEKRETAEWKLIENKILNIREEIIVR